MANRRDQSVPSRSISRSLNFWIFPDGVAGIASRTISRSGMYCTRDLLGLQELDHRRRSRCVWPGLGHDHRAGALAQPLVRVGHDGHLGHRRVPVQQRLDLDHRDVLAAADDHVLAAAA